MRVDPAHLRTIIAELESIRSHALRLEREHEPAIAAGGESARNLVHYLALRDGDRGALQTALARLGLSSLERAEPHVLATIDSVLVSLYRLAGREAPRFEVGEPKPRAFVEGGRRLERRADELFGPRVPSKSDSGRVRIMVTMPTAAAVSYELVRDLVLGGMDCMRINCAHDTPVEWAAMASHLAEARRETGRPAKLLMDLGGPKLRTGAIEPGLRVVRWDPKRDALGNVVGPALVWLTPIGRLEVPPPGTSATVPIDASILEAIEPEDRIDFLDARGRKRTLEVRSRHGASLLAESEQLTYLGADCVLSVRRRSAAPGACDVPSDFRPEGIEPIRQAILLRAGDTLRLTRDPTPGRPVRRDVDGRHVEVPRVPCTLPEVFRFVKEGERILFDDGKIAGVITSASMEELRVTITHPEGEEKKLGEDKGINLPDSDLDLPALTSKDLEDLDVVLEHADLVGLSFVERVEDVEALEREIAKRTSRPVGIILKIETRRAFAELPSLLLAALRIERVGVMIARGDLAVECGFERLADLQEEILALCGAAHVPVIWATQVLEKLSKKGMPSRAEISDAALGARAECVMLNKGPYVVEAVRMLEDIFGRTERRLSEKMPVLCRLPVSKGVDSNDRDGVALAERGARRGAAVAFALENALLTDDEPAPPTR